MKCYTNRNNPLCLKLLLASSFAGKSVQVEYVTLKGTTFVFLIFWNEIGFALPRSVEFSFIICFIFLEWRDRGGKTLPTIALENGDQIFSSNAVVRNILQPREDLLASVDLWLDWESSVLLVLLKYLDFVPLFLIWKFLHVDI